MAESPVGREILRPGIGIRPEDLFSATAAEAGTGNDLRILDLLAFAWLNYTTAPVFLQ